MNETLLLWGEMEKIVDFSQVLVLLGFNWLLVLCFSCPSFILLPEQAHNDCFPTVGRSSMVNGEMAVKYEVFFFFFPSSFKFPLELAN